MSAIWLVSALSLSLSLSPRVGVTRECAGVLRISRIALSLAPASPSAVRIEPDAEAVGKSVFAAVEAAAEAAIAERGSFALAIPGGSILKMLADTAPEWAAKTTVVYVNHKVRSGTRWHSGG